jgi:hypothetical protein
MEAAIAREQHGKYVSTVINKRDTTEELLAVVSSV